MRRATRCDGRHRCPIAIWSVCAPHAAGDRKHAPALQTCWSAISVSDELVFYTNPTSRGRVVRWMLEELGQPYRTEILEFGTSMKSAAYLAINPLGKVPALRHGDAIITEGAAIC